MYVHFPTNAGTAETPDVEAIERVARETDTPLLNVHLVARGQDWAGADVDAPEFAGAVADRLVRDVVAFAERVGPERVIAENLIYTGPGSEYLRAAVEPRVIRRVLEETGCGLLLDLSHARIAARYMGVDWKDYLSQLPLERLRELHVTGLAEVDGVLVDHEPLTEQDWADVEWAMERIRQRRLAASRGWWRWSTGASGDLTCTARQDSHRGAGPTVAKPGRARSKSAPQAGRLNAFFAAWRSRTAGGMIRRPAPCGRRGACG